MLKDIPKSDIIVRPLKAYKEWTVDQNDVLPIFGKKINDSVFDNTTDEKSGGFYKRLVYDSIAAQFYRNSDTASVLTEVGRRKNYTSTDERNLQTELAVISVPQIYYGEGFKPGTISLRDGATTYTDDGYSNLIDIHNTIYGNIFYDRGTVVLTKNVVSGSTLSDYSLYFRSTKTIYENEIFVSVLEHEFNASQNPSAVYEDGASSYVATVTNHLDPTRKSTYEKTIYTNGVRYIKNKNYPFISKLDSTKMASFDDYEVSGSVDPTGSYLAPYISTIGLYDNELNLVAVAKLPQPIKSLPDYPLNFIVRFDT
jgi:hypothetical protein